MSQIRTCSNPVIEEALNGFGGDENDKRIFLSLVKNAVDAVNSILKGDHSISRNFCLGEVYGSKYICTELFLTRIDYCVEKTFRPSYEDDFEIDYTIFSSYSKDENPEENQYYIPVKQTFFLHYSGVGEEYHHHWRNSVERENIVLNCHYSN